jgi:hypothetical protein
MKINTEDIFLYVLYFVGYNFTPEVQMDAPLDIELQDDGTYIGAKTKRDNSELFFRDTLFKLYNFIILCLIMWPLFYSSVISIIYGSILYFGRTLFQLMFAFQYWKASVYFNKDHFYTNIANNSELMYYFRIVIPICSILSILIGIMNVVLFNNGYYFGAYSMICCGGFFGNIMVNVLLFFESLYSHQIFFINCCIFVINMLYHKTVIFEYSMNLEEYIKYNIDNVKKINMIAMEYSKMKDKFDKTVYYLTPFFSSLNFIGIVGIYFYLRVISSDDDSEEGNLTPNEISNILVFTIVEIVYINSIQTVNQKVEQISDLIGGNNFIDTFFAYKSHSISLHSIGNTRNITTNLLSVLNSDPTLSDKKNINNEELNALLKNVLIKVSSTDQTLSWMALRGVVSENWKTFRIFGLEITDTKIIYRIFGLCVGLVVTAEVGTLANWW